MELKKFLERLVHYRRRIWDGAVQDVRQRYVGSMFGVAWAVLTPLLQLVVYAGIYTFIFRVRPSGLGEYGYVLLVFSGLAPLMAFNEILTSSMNSLSTNKELLLNTVFPGEFIPLRAGLAGQATSLIGLLIALGAGFALGRTGWQALLLVPVFWFLLFMFAMGIGWLLSLVAIVAKDIQHSISVILMLVMMLSPFAYTPEMLPKAMKPLIYLNPMSYFVMPFQSLICYGTWPDPIVGTVAFLLALTSFTIGVTIFQRVKNVFFDYA